MFFKAILMFALSCAALAAPDIHPIPHQPSYNAAPHHQPSYNTEPQPYQYNYAVRDEYAGTDFGQTEESDGKSVQGSYTVQLPDGRKQTVTYVADHEGGYNAEVSYYGEPQYPNEYGPAVTFKPQAYHEPSYQPQPSYQ